MPHELRLTTLGHVTVTLDGEPVCNLPAKALALLVYLAVTARPHSREHLANLLWSEGSETEAQASLRKALSNLKPIADSHLLLEKATVAFDRAQPYWVDVEELANRTSHIAHRPSASTIRDTPYAIREFGDFLQTLTIKNAPEFEVWILEQREKYRARAAELFQRVAQEKINAGNERAALDALNRLVALDTWNENAHQAAMRVLARLGKHKDALAQYQQLKQVLHNDLDIEPSPETTALFEHIRDARPLAPTPPTHPTPFIGREAERAELAQWLAQPATRLITLFGPGGIGKTRLALAAAEQLRERFLHGSAYISLEAVDAASNVIPTIGAAFPFSFRRTSDAVTQLGNFLQDKELLLVLDNFEQVLDAANDLAQLLQLAPQVKILVTSRARLALQAERVFEVRGLAYQDLEGFQNLRGLDAARLFAERAQRVSPTFAWNEENAHVVTRICRAVEGMPLALELAAGLTRGASVETIASQLERDLTALDSDLRDVSERHRSVRAVFEQSWRALNERERNVLQKLSVFRGGFEANAAREISNADAATLGALIDKALIYRASETRFDLHALVREFAREKLVLSEREGSNATQETRARHAKFFNEFLAARATRIIGGTQVETIQELRVELENARLAWQWSVAQGDGETLNRTAPVLYRYHEAQSLYQPAETLLAPAAEFSYIARARLGATFYFLGKLEDARRELNEALSRARNANNISETAFCFLQLGNVAFDAGDFGDAEKNYLECLTRARATNDFYLLTDSSNNLAFVAARRGEMARAREFCQHAIDAAAQIDEKRGIAGALINLSLIEYSQGNFDASRNALERALPLFDAVGDQRGVNMTLANLGELAREANDWARAEELYRHALKGYQAIGQPEKIAQQFHNLGDVATQREKYDEAWRLYSDALAVYKRIGARYWEANTHCSLGEVALKTREVTRAQKAFETALGIATEIDATPRAMDALFGLARVDELQNNFARAMERGAQVVAHPATDHQTRRAAQEFLDTLARGLEEEEFQQALAGGQDTEFLARDKS